VLEGVQFVRLHKGVYRHRHHVMTFEDHLTAARLALPAGARTTGATRLQEIGLDVGPARPLHFVVEGDLHLVLEGVFLHRTVLMPPHDDDGVSVEAAFVAYCASARVIDAIKAGSVLLEKCEMSVDALAALLDEQPWRRGVAETRWVLPHLDARCRSLPEAELVAMIRFAGLPEPEVNRTLVLGEGVEVTPDLWWPAYDGVVEYEGAQHQEDRDQYVADIDRYVVYRRRGTRYRQVTRERMRAPKDVARHVHELLLEGGYQGPAPDFGGLWDSLFQRISDVVLPQRIARAG
jgi:hypothetical protein